MPDLGDLALLLIIATPIAWFVFGLGLVDEAIRYVTNRWRQHRDAQVSVTAITITEALSDFTGSEERYV